MKTTLTAIRLFAAALLGLCLVAPGQAQQRTGQTRSDDARQEQRHDQKERDREQERHHGDDRDGDRDDDGHGWQPKVQVRLTAPLAGTPYTAPATVTLAADAQARQKNHPIVRVEFYRGTTRIGVATAVPYTVVWNAVPAGSYRLTARAINNKGDAAVSPPVAVIINAPPTVSLTSPTAGLIVTAPGTLTLSANAVDSDGTIAKVEYYQGSTLIGTATTAPFAMTWSNVPQGDYRLTAKATDNRGATSTSAAVTVTVNASGPAPGIYYVHPDHLGTPRLITDQQQRPVWRWENQEPFGNNPPNQDPANTGIVFPFNLRFPGQYFDSETGLSYNYFRDYNPAIGRYVQVDPIGLEGGINTYSYVVGNPLSHVDPTGEFAWAIPAVGLVTGALIGGMIWSDTDSATPPYVADDDGYGQVCDAAEHTKNQRPSNWNKHTKPRPGRDSEKKRNQPGWTPKNPNKKK